MSDDPGVRQLFERLVDDRPAAPPDVAAIRRRGLLRRTASRGGALAVTLAIAGLVLVNLPTPNNEVIFTEPGHDEGAEPTQELREPAPPPDPDPNEQNRASSEDATSIDHGAPLWGRSFIAVAASQHGEPRPLRNGVTISFMLNTLVDPPSQWISWPGDCGSSGSPIEVTADRINIVGGEFATMPYCGERNEYRGQADWLDLREFFRSEPSWRVRGDRLWVWTDDTLIEWRDDHWEPPPPPPCTPHGDDPCPQRPAFDKDVQEEGASSDHGAPLWGHRFVLVAASENGRPRTFLPGQSGTVVFSDRTDGDPSEQWIIWRSECSRTSIRVEVTPNRLRGGFGAQGSLEECADEWHQQDAWVTRIIESNPYWRVEGERLWLWTRDKLIEWRLDDDPPPPPCEFEPEIEPCSEEAWPAGERQNASVERGAPLWGHRFVAVTANEHGQPRAFLPGRSIVIAFSYRKNSAPPNQWISWSGGCNRRSSMVEVTADRLNVVPGAGGVGPRCADEWHQQDAWVTQIIESNPYWRVEGERLWLWIDDTVVEWRLEDDPPPCEPDPDPCPAEVTAD